MSAIHTEEVAVAGRKARLLRCGSGPTVVLVHGLGLSADFYRYHLELLAGAGYCALAPDMPGFGRSPGPAFGHTVEHAAAWLAELARTTRVARAAWVGHSVSAQYVLRLAVLEPSLAAALVLAAPTGEPGRLRWIGQLAGLARTSIRERPRFAARVLASYLTTPPTRVIGSWLGGRRHLALADATLVRCPVHIVLGGRDPVVPRAFANRLAGCIPAAELISIPESAHGVALSPVAPFGAVLVDCLSRTFPPRYVEKAVTGGGKRVDIR